jgi:hypothetical protein
MTVRTSPQEVADVRVMVDLSGIEPLASSLRTTDAESATDSLSELKWREFMALLSSDKTPQ